MLTRCMLVAAELVEHVLGRQRLHQGGAQARAAAYPPPRCTQSWSATTATTLAPRRLLPRPPTPRPIPPEFPEHGPVRCRTSQRGRKQCCVRWRGRWPHKRVGGSCWVSATTATPPAPRRRCCVWQRHARFRLKLRLAGPIYRLVVAAGRAPRSDATGTEASAAASAKATPASAKCEKVSARCGN